MHKNRCYKSAKPKNTKYLYTKNRKKIYSKESKFGKKHKSYIYKEGYKIRRGKITLYFPNGKSVYPEKTVREEINGNALLT